MSVTQKNITQKNYTYEKIPYYDWSVNIEAINALIDYNQSDYPVVLSVPDNGNIGIPAVPTSLELLMNYDYSLFKKRGAIICPDLDNVRKLRLESLSSYNFMHDGSGGTLFLVIEPDELTAFISVCGNVKPAFYNQIGFAVAIDNSPSQLRYYVNNGSGTDNAARIIHPITSNPGKMVISARYIDNTLTGWLNGVMVGESSILSPSTSNSTGFFHIMGYPDIQPMKGKFSNIKIINSALTNNQIEFYSIYLNEVS